jgi:hypothetical protein
VKEPPSSLSSRIGRPSVNLGPHSPPRIPIRRILRIERDLRNYRPTFRPPPGPPPRPAETGHVLAALARTFTATDRVGIVQIAEAAGVSEAIASSVRKWAKSRGKWPYLDRLSGFAVLASRPRRRKGGAS